MSSSMMQQQEQRRASSSYGSSTSSHKHASSPSVSSPLAASPDRNSPRRRRFMSTQLAMDKQTEPSEHGPFSCPSAPHRLENYRTTSSTWYEPPTSPMAATTTATTATNAATAACYEAPYSTGQGRPAEDDDDSLVFNMSELECDTHQQQKPALPAETSVSLPTLTSQPYEGTTSPVLHQPLTAAAYNTRDYARRLALIAEANRQEEEHKS
ncbi:hypothetical protein BCR43DRAFT_273112 [Syncephalastrum racemosum]|uniref:Uncharacterized protein n=1 Tax=Syncephalastrum racemosum TaxID=13706 RepID=A0A1X2HC24_SYNRA|nr:hypothetical protein BCR43DRAFT_273112 [Syncephalastrum racemosum]